MLFLSLIILRRFSLRLHSLGLEFFLEKFNVPLKLLCFHMSLLKKNKNE